MKKRIFLKEGAKQIVILIASFLMPLFLINTKFSTISLDQILQCGLLISLLITISFLFIHIRDVNNYIWIGISDYIFSFFLGNVSIITGDYLINKNEIVIEPLWLEILLLIIISTLLIICFIFYVFIYKLSNFINPFYEVDKVEFEDEPIKRIDDLNQIINNVGEDLKKTTLFENLKLQLEQVSQNIIKSQKNGVICIDGVWGSGKTTFVNLVEDTANKKTSTWYRFDTMHYTNYTELTNDFFNGLMLHLEKNYGIFLKSEINQIATLLSPIIEKNFYMDIKLLLSGKRDLKELKNRIAESLCKAFKNNNDNKLIIVIDDIDRLDPDDLLAIFKLIKFLSDLPNVLIITPFDYDKVNNIIVQKYKNNYEGYIDKIVNYRIKLNSYNYNELRAIFSNEMLSNEQTLRQFDSLWENVVLNSNKVRLVNRIKINEPFNKDLSHTLNRPAIDPYYKNIVFDLIIKNHNRNYLNEMSFRKDSVSISNGALDFVDAITWSSLDESFIKLYKDYASTLIKLNINRLNKVEKDIDQSIIEMTHKHRHSGSQKIIFRMFIEDANDAIIQLLIDNDNLEKEIVLNMLDKVMNESISKSYKDVDAQIIKSSLKEYLERIIDSYYKFLPNNYRTMENKIKEYFVTNILYPRLVKKLALSIINTNSKDASGVVIESIIKDHNI